MVIILRPYTKSTAPLLRQWLDARDQSNTTLDDLPETGIVAHNKDGKAIAAGFLRRCEGNYAMIDSLVTDPAAEKLERHIAMDGIMKKLIETAKDLGVKALIGTTVDKNTQARAERLGFLACPHTLMSLKIESN